MCIQQRKKMKHKWIFILIGILVVVQCKGEKLSNESLNKERILVNAMTISDIQGHSGAGTTGLTVATVATSLTPTLSPEAGVYNSDQSISIISATQGATIYYTLDGSTPNTTSTSYTGSIPIAGQGTTKTIKAIAVKAGMTNSLVATALYTINYNAVSMPTFNPAAGSYSTAQTISMTTTTTGATIYYTTDGTTPTTSSTLYTAPIHIWSLAGKTIKAYAVKTGSTDSSVLSKVYSYFPLKTGQTLCYDENGALISCVGTGQDGDIQSGVAKSYTGPTAHATYTSDYTTKDNATGLVWKSCSQGKSGATCTTGSAQTLSNDGTATDASNHATYGCFALNGANSGNGYAGIKTWRLPTAKELSSLSSFGALAIDTTAFPNPPGGNHWSSTAYLITAGNSYLVKSDALLTNIVNTTLYYVRCVSGTPNVAVKNFTDNADGTIKDNTTGLTWQKCSMGQTNNSTCSGAITYTTWDNALTYCNSTLNNLPASAPRTWRMPNINELQSIEDYTKVTNFGPDADYFPNAAGGGWVSTTHTGILARSWCVNYTTTWWSCPKTNTNAVRCVSG